MSEKSNIPYFVGVDIGSSMIRCVIGSIDEEGVPEIIGHSEAPSIGMRRGVVTQAEEVGGVISEVITAAQRLSGKQITGATVNINGSHVEGIDSKGVVAISAVDREVSIEDRLRVEEAASVMKMPANREIIQIFPKEYSLDGQGSIKNPVGMQGVRLEVDTHIVTSSVPHVRSVEQAMEYAGLHIKHRSISSLASAEAVLNRQQREAGTAVVDIGAGTTNLIIIEDGEVQFVSVIPVGGKHITNDLAIGLKTDLDIAEEVKLQHATLTNSVHSVVSVKKDKTQHTFDASTVRMVVEARIEELLELIDKELKKAGKSKKLPGGVVFTGGSSKINGLADFAKDQLELPTKVATLLPVSGLSDISKDVSYATVIGLMMLDMLLESVDDSESSNSVHGIIENPILNKISGLIKKANPF